MALVTNFKCSHCGHSVCEVVYYDRICTTCRDALAKIAKDSYMDICASRTLEERVRIIEERLYELDAEKRLRALESRNQKY